MDFDFSSLKRRDLQALCKRNNIPANLTNAAMADALNSLEIVEGVEDLVQLENVGSESPERSMITSANVPRTSTRLKPNKEECSNLATTRTRCGTRRADVEGTETRKIPATRATRRKATQEPVIQRKTEEELQAEFEQNLEQSQGSEHSEVSEEVSGVTVDQPEVNIDDGGETVDKPEVYNKVVEESAEMSNGSQNVDFHSLARKDLQNLCKRNKIPANTTNAAMADALESLDIVEGLDEFLKEYDPLAIKSPGTSRMTSTRTRQGRTDRKTTARKSVRARSALCKSLTKKIEDLNVEEDGECPVSVDAAEVEISSVDKNLQSHLEACTNKSEFEEYAPEKCNSIDGEPTPVSEEVSIEADTSVNASQAEKELEDKTVDPDELESNVNLEPEVELQDDTPENASGNQQVEVNNSEEIDTAEITKTDTDPSDKQNVDGVEFDNIGVTEVVESDTDSSDESSAKDSIQEAPALGTEGFDQSIECSDTEDLKQVGDLVNEDDSTEDNSDVEDVTLDNTKPEPEEGSDVAEDNSITQIVDIEPKPIEVDTSKKVGDLVKDVDTEEASDVEENISILVKDDTKPEVGSDFAEDNSFTETVDIGLKSGSISNLKCCDEEQDGRNSEISQDNEPENCHLEFEKQVTFVSDITESLCRAEKNEDDCTTEHQVSEKVVAEASEPAPKVKETPLNHKSLRKLKKMLRDKLQETNVLAKKLENLTLEDDLDKPVEGHLGEGTQEAEGMSDVLNLTTVTELDAETDAQISSDNASEDDKDANNPLSTNETVEFGVNILACNEVSEDSVTGQINVESVDCDDSNLRLESLEKECAIEKLSIELTSLEPITPRKIKPFVLTPHKAISAGRTNSVVDANKENIDSGRKTETGKINLVVSPPMSMGKLKKEVKVRLQQSEKKRTALQSRSDNQFPLGKPLKFICGLD